MKEKGRHTREVYRAERERTVRGERVQEGERPSVGERRVANLSAGSCLRVDLSVLMTVILFSRQSGGTDGRRGGEGVEEREPLNSMDERREMK